MKSTILCAAFVASILSGAPDASAVNYVEVFLDREDVASDPSRAFLAEVIVALEDETGVTGVSVTAGATPLTLEQHSPGGSEWSGELGYTSLADLKAALDGTWTLTVSGSSASTSTFTLLASTLADSDFFATPTGLMPVHGSTDVALGTTLSWTDPTGGATPYVVGVTVGEDSGGEQEDISSPFGTLAVTDVMWTPPAVLFPGTNDFEVFYEDVDFSFITALSVMNGSITWGNSPSAPTGAPFGPWPAATPLLALGALTSVQFTTAPLVEDFESYSLQADTTGPGDFFVTTTGNLADPVVASGSEALAASAGIADDAGNQVWALGSAMGTTDTEGFLLIGDLPGLGGSTTAGPFADFFAGPRQLFGATIRARVRETTAAATTQFRFLVSDPSDNEAATDLRPLGADFAQYQVNQSDFVDFTSNSGPTDFSQIVAVSFEFFVDPAAPATAPALQFQIDDVELVPEPSSPLLGLTALASLALTARLRRQWARFR